MGTIRLLLAISVVFRHLGHELGVGGQNAVQIFYMISGFLISFVLTQNKTYAVPYKFWANRALRLYPAYYAVLGFALTLRMREPGFLDSFMELPSVAKKLLVTVNLSVFGQDWIEFLAVKDGQVAFARDLGESGQALWNFLMIEPAWSLGVELSFYAIAPFIIRKQHLLWSLLAVSVTARLLAMAAGFGVHDPWTYRFFPFELAFFIAGALSHQYLSGPTRRLAEIYPSLRLDAAAWLALALFCITFSWVPSGPLTWALLFAGMLVCLPLLFEFQKRVRFDNALGELSYPLYICHVPAIYQLEAWTSSHGQQSIVFAAAAMAASLAFAIFLKRAVIDPVEVWRRRIAGDTRATLEDSPTMFIELTGRTGSVSG